MTKSENSQKMLVIRNLKSLKLWSSFAEANVPTWGAGCVLLIANCEQKEI